MERSAIIRLEIEAFVNRHASEYGTRDAETLVRARSRRIVQDAITGKRGMGAWNGPPFNLRMLASMLGCVVQECRDPALADAQLIPHDTLPGRGVIGINPDRPETRINFSIGHELGHSLFQPKAICYRDESDDPDVRELERLCDIAASEFLMPFESFKQDVAMEGVSIDSVLKLGQRYVASSQATAYRMLGFEKSRPWAVAVLAYTWKPLEERNRDQLLIPGIGAEPPRKLRILSVSASTPDFPLLPKHKSIDDACPLVAAFHASAWPFKGDLSLRLDKKRQVSFYVEATRLAPDQAPQALALLFLR